MKTYRYQLEPYKGMSSRYTCPQCGSKKTFVRYIDTQTGKHITDDTGRCNRQEKCGYHKKPSHTVMTSDHEGFRGSVVISRNTNTHFVRLPRPLRYALCPRNDGSVLFPHSIYKQSLFNYNHNNLVLYLHSILPYRDMERVVDSYHIGTLGNSTVFWQKDIKGNIRGGKVMAYDSITGKRRKDIPHAIQWMHTIHKVEDFELKQCFFGEHLLRDNALPVAIVESEKTALIAAALMPQYTWLATGGINNLSAEKCKVLHGRKVTLYPDAGAYDKWNVLRKHIPHCSISPLLENGFAAGSDMADYLLAA
jgi:hypothetical protein